MANKMPYIPLYIGDWEQDTNGISLEAEGALLKLIFKLWKSPTKGLLTISLSYASILVKKNEQKTLEIIQELQANNILNIEFLAENKIKIESRRMLKETHIKQVRSEAGKKGVKAKKNCLNKISAKHQQIPEYENEIDNVNRFFLKGNETDFEVFAESIHRLHKIPPDQLDPYLEEFDDWLISTEETHRTLKSYKYHFGSWLRKKLESKKNGSAINKADRDLEALKNFAG